MTPALTAAAAYTLTCSGVGGSISRAASVAISASTPAPTAESASTIGPYAVQTYTGGIATGSHYKIPKIWYPVGGSGPYPGVVFVPGLNSSYTEDPYTVSISGETVVEADITQWGELLASHGFVVMFIDTTNYGAQPAERATALLEAVEGLAAENTRSASPLLGLLDAQNIAVMGHSYGGAGALYAVNGGTNSRITAAIGLSPVPNAGYYPNDIVPSLIIAGYGDPFFTDFEGEYNSIPSTTSKMLAYFSRSSEFDSMHSVGLVPLGTHTVDPIVARIGLSFLEVYLKGDLRYQQFLVTNPYLYKFAYNP